jgi:hypothetical protein
VGAKPALVLTRKDSALVLSWPLPDYACHVEASGTLSGPWTRVSPQGVVGNGQMTLVINPPTGPQRFYRLAEGN